MIHWLLYFFSEAVGGFCLFGLLFLLLCFCFSVLLVVVVCFSGRGVIIINSRINHSLFFFPCCGTPPPPISQQCRFTLLLQTHFEVPYKVCVFIQTNQ